MSVFNNFIMIIIYCGHDNLANISLAQVLLFGASMKRRPGAGLSLTPLNWIILISTHLMLCVATAILNFKWLKITHIRIIWDQKFANLDDEALISFPISIIWSANKIVSKRL